MRAAAEVKRQVTRQVTRGLQGAAPRGVGVYGAKRIVDLPGQFAQAGCPGTRFRFTLSAI
jgi:hypothetical protein